MPRPMVAEPLPIKPVRLILGLIACIGLVLTFLTLLFGFASIPANSVGVKTRFGAYHDIVNPGLAYAIPYIDEIHIVPTQRLLKLEFGFTSPNATNRSEEHTSELSHANISYAVFCLKKKNNRLSVT